MNHHTNLQHPIHITKMRLSALLYPTIFLSSPTHTLTLPRSDLSPRTDPSSSYPPGHNDQTCPVENSITIDSDPAPPDSPPPQSSPPPVTPVQQDRTLPPSITSQICRQVGLFHLTTPTWHERSTLVRHIRYFALGTTAVESGLYVASAVVHGEGDQIHRLRVSAVGDRDWNRRTRPIEYGLRSAKVAAIFQIMGEAKKLHFETMVAGSSVWRGGELALFRLGPRGYGGVDREAWRAWGGREAG